MAEEVRADPLTLGRLARTTLDASGRLADAWSDVAAAVAAPVAAFGNLAAGPLVHGAAQAAAEAATTTVDRLVAVHEGDVDRLYRTAFAYEQADRAAAQRSRRPGGRPVPE